MEQHMYNGSQYVQPYVYNGIVSVWIQLIIRNIVWWRNNREIWSLSGKIIK